MELVRFRRRNTESRDVYDQEKGKTKVKNDERDTEGGNVGRSRVTEKNEYHSPVDGRGKRNVKETKRSLSEKRVLN